MFYVLIWIVVSLFLFWICVRSRYRFQQGLPIYPLESNKRLLSEIMVWGGKGFLFLFCCVWTSLVLESLFPHYASHSWFFSSDTSGEEKQAPYSATLFIVDRSSSMKTAITPSETRLDFVKQCVVDIVKEVDKEGYGKDVFGLMPCARLAPLLVPMTRNRPFFMKAVQSIHPEENPKLNGTALGYALFKGTFLLLALEQYAKRNALETLPREARSIVFITDGLEEVNPQDYQHPFRSIPFKEALQQAKAFGIRVWYILVDPGERTFFSSYSRERLLQLTESTQGGFVEINPHGDPESALKKVSQSLILSAKKPKGKPTLPDAVWELKIGLMILCLLGMRASEHVRYGL